VLPLDGQQLTITVNAEDVASETVEPGPLDLRIPLPPSRARRRVELHWAGTSLLSADDPRQVAALVKFLDVVPIRAPSALHLPSALANSGLDYAGIYRDGWVQQAAYVVLAGGAAGDLVIKGEAPDPGQHLRVTLDGRAVIDEKLEAGPIDVRARLPAADTVRRVELHWSEARPVASEDGRQASALLKFIGIGSGNAPAAIRRVPDDLADPNLDSEGVYEDGWLEQQSRIVLAGGAAGELVIRAAVPQRRRQSLDVLVDGHLTSSTSKPPEALHLRLPVPASDSNRRIELRWAETGVVATNDPRQAAALLQSIGIASGQAPLGIRSIPGDLGDPRLDYAGIHEDGWLERDSRVVLAGGGAGKLLIRAQVPTQAGQHLDVVVDGRTVSSRNVTPGTLHFRVPIPSATMNRCVELHWAGAGAVSADDPREVAALLEILAIVPGGRG
jgi:hypothetical protein